MVRKGKYRFLRSVSQGLGSAFIVLVWCYCCRSNHRSAVPFTKGIALAPQQVNHPEGYGLNANEHGYDVPHAPTVANDEVDIDLSWSEGDERFVTENPYKVPRLVREFETWTVTHTFSV